MPRSRASGAARALSLVLVLTAPLAAQNTHFVYGPDLQTAIAAAAPGDVLIVDGVYSGIGLTIDKPLSIHGRPGAAIRTLLQPTLVDAIPAGASLVLQGFTLTWLPLRVQRCAGSVLLADVHAPAAVGMLTTIDDCRQVAIDECTFGAGLEISSSTAMIARSELTGSRAARQLNVPSSAGLTVYSGQVVAVASRFVGGAGDGSGPFDAAAGVALDDSGIRLSGGGNVVAAGSNPASAIHAVSGSGTVENDARTTFAPAGGGAAIDPRSWSRVMRLAVTAINRTALGERAVLSIVGDPGRAFALLGAAPIVPLRIPGIEGELWTSPSPIVQGLLGHNGAFALAFTVPDFPELRGFLFRWQGITTDGSVVRFAEPVTECHR